MLLVLAEGVPYQRHVYVTALQQVLLQDQRADTTQGSSDERHAFSGGRGMQITFNTLYGLLGASLRSREDD